MTESAVIRDRRKKQENRYLIWNKKSVVRVGKVDEATKINVFKYIIKCPEEYFP